MSNAAILFLALLIDALLGEPKWLWDRIPHPAILMGQAIKFGETLLNDGTGRKIKGTIAVIVCSISAIAVGVVLSWFGPVAEILVVAILLAQRSLVDHVRAVSQGLRVSLGDGRTMVARIVSRDARNMDESAVARSAIESASENLSDGVIAPAFWFLVAGLPGLVLYKVINTADSMIGYRTPQYRDFGWAAARLDDLLNLLPARLTAVLVLLISGQLDQWRDVVKDARRHRSPNAGWPEAAMARALNIALAGPRSYDGVLTDFPFVHPRGRMHLTALDIDNTAAKLWQVWVLTLAACATLAVF